MGLRSLQSSLNTASLRKAASPDADPSSTKFDDLNQPMKVGKLENLVPGDWQSFPLGVVAGLQYNQDTYGKCFYAMVDTVGFYDFFLQDYQLLLTEANFYNLLVYDPIRFSSNLAALFE